LAPNVNQPRLHFAKALALGAAFDDKVIWLSLMLLPAIHDPILVLSAPGGYPLTVIFSIIEECANML
jgi:hypothetical protein